MRMQDTEVVDGTRVTIGRRIVYRTVNGQRIERVLKTYSAEYRNNGRRRVESLRTTIRREARRKAIEIQQRLDSGRSLSPNSRISIAQLIERYTAFNESKGLTRKTLAKYAADLDKLREFCAIEGIERADRFDEEAFHRFGAWLRERTHKQGDKYAGKTLYTTLTIAKQLLKWGWRSRLLPSFEIASAKLPTGRPRPQPTFQTEQVEALLERCEGTTHAAIALLAYTGMRVGELEQLRWADVDLDAGDLGMLHVRLGGSCDAPKDKEPRLVPIHERVRPIIEALPRTDERVLPELRARTLLARIKRLCTQLGYGDKYKTHSLRHHFASMCANSAVPYRMALAWMGHSSSDILSQYYHLHDEESQAAMRIVAQRTESLRDRVSTQR